MRGAKKCFNCGEKPYHLTRTDENTNDYEWEDVDGKVYDHLIIHKGCPMGREVYHDTRARALKRWNDEQSK